MQTASDILLILALLALLCVSAGCDSLSFGATHSETNGNSQHEGGA